MAKPIVNGIEKDLDGTAEVVRINMLTSTARELAQRFEIKGVPTTIVLDGNGSIVYQHAGLPNRKAVVASVVRD